MLIIATDPIRFEPGTPNMVKHKQTCRKTNWQVDIETDKQTATQSNIAQVTELLTVIWVPIIFTGFIIHWLVPMSSNTVADKMVQ